MSSANELRAYLAATVGQQYADDIWFELVAFVATWIEQNTAWEQGVVGFSRTLAEEWREAMNGPKAL